MYEIDWNGADLERGKPELMDNPTFIEWITRQLESPEETEAREQERQRKHAEWHKTAPGIYACCIRWQTDKE